MRLHCRYRVRNIGVIKQTAMIEAVASNRLQPFRQICAKQTVTVIKDIGSQRGKPVIKIDVSQVVAIIKRIVTAAFDHIG